MATTTVGRTTIQGATTVGGFNPATLFSAGEQGVWYDPSDLSTLFQDSAGTIPVTALEQPVGRMLDKSGRGNHATQSTNTSFRPVVSARVNLATYTNDLGTGSWTVYGSGRAAATGPTGVASSAVTITASAGGTYHTIQSATINGTTANANYTLSVYAKAGTSTFACVNLYSITQNFVSAVFNLNDITATTASETKLGTTSGTLVSTSQSYIGNGWFRLSVTGNFNRTDINPIFCIANAATGNTFDIYGQTTFSAAGTESIILFGADLRPTNQGVGLPVYQRVGAAVAGTSTTVGNADYDANGFPVYLKFDGSNDSLATGNINLSGTDTITTFAGARKLSDAALGMLWEISADAGSNTGTAYQTFPVNVGGSTRILARGSISNGVDYGPYAAPVTQLTSTVQKTAAANSTAAISFRVNSVTASGSVVSSNASTGNYGTWPIYIGSRGGTTFYYNGLLYGLIVRGASSTANQITGAENWLNQKTAAY